MRGMGFLSVFASDDTPIGNGTGHTVGWSVDLLCYEGILVLGFAMTRGVTT